MFTRTQALSKSIDAHHFRELREAKKTWVHFGDLYPCILEDPIQIFIKHKLKLLDMTLYTNDNSLQEQKDAVHGKYSNHLFFVSKQLNKARFDIFDSKIRQEYMDFISNPQHTPSTNFFFVPFFNFRSKLKVMIDMIITKKFLSVLDQSWNPSAHPTDSIHSDKNHVVVCLVQTKKTTAYQRYQAHFIQKTLSTHRNMIDLSSIYFYNMDSSTLTCYCIEDEESKTYQRKISDDCRWLRNCTNPDTVYTLFPPSHPYLYPNMKVSCKQPFYEKWKYNYAKELNEITLLWKCTTKHRNLMHQKGIYSFMDPKFNTEDLMLTSKKDEDILQRMLSLYRNEDQVIDVPQELVFPETKVDFFVDFETLNNVIYWIGVGKFDGQCYEYHEFGTKDCTISEQERIMQYFVTFLKSFPNKTVYYWYAEKIFWNRANEMNTISIPMNFDNWIDLWEVFSRTPVLIKSCFNFKLKTIARGMKKMNMINIVCPEECGSGQDSMVIADRYFRNYSIEDYRILKDYNYFDCRVMYEILSFLKEFLRSNK
jgi:hypothetical protein